MKGGKRMETLTLGGDEIKLALGKGEKLYWNCHQIKGKKVDEAELTTYFEFTTPLIWNFNNSTLDCNLALLQRPIASGVLIWLEGRKDYWVLEVENVQSSRVLEFWAWSNKEAPIWRQMFPGDKLAVKKVYHPTEVSVGNLVVPQSTSKQQPSLLSSWCLRKVTTDKVYRCLILCQKRTRRHLTGFGR